MKLHQLFEDNKTILRNILGDIAPVENDDGTDDDEEDYDFDENTYERGSEEVQLMFIRVKDDGFEVRIKYWFSGDREDHIDLDAKIKDKKLEVKFDVWETEFTNKSEFTRTYDLSSAAYGIRLEIDKIKDHVENANDESMMDDDYDGEGIEDKHTFT